MSKRDLYKVLGVAKTATQDEIKKAYKKLASKHHPDKEGGDTAAFQEISAANDILSDPTKREMYDIGGHDAANGHHQHGGGWNQTFHQHFNQPPAGENVVTVADITLEEAATGVKKVVTYRRVELCDPCNGEGAKPGTEIITCTTCGGKGQQTVRQGPYVMSMGCQSCGGKGKKPAEVCPSCNGAGARYGQGTVEVSLPPGVDTGQQLRVVGKGGYGPGGFGNLYVNIRIQPHATITRDGRHLYTTANVPFTTAILGGSINVATLLGPDVSMKIPPLTQPGVTMRVAGKGIKTVQNTTEGDFMVKVNVVMPTTITDEQKATIEKFVELSQEG
jgi:molecular chaperone DnaJ